MIYTINPDYPFTNGLVRNNRIELDNWQHGRVTNPAGVTYTGMVVLPP